MNNFGLGLLLMIVGMTSVFAILLLVIGLGKGLISLVNKYAPEEIIVKQKQRVSNLPLKSDAGQSGAATAAIVSAVSVLTGGQGHVTKIEKR